MQKLRGLFREHWHALALITLLTLVVTFPTIVYVFQTDVFWLPSGHSDIYIKLWDMWYGNLVLTGQAQRIFTDVIFYPEGVSLATHPLDYMHILVVNALAKLLPFSNAFILSYQFIIVVTALTAYGYLMYLIKEKWLAIFGAVVFGFGPHVLSHYNHPAFMFLAPLPLCVYFFQRGITENRRKFLILCGLIVGLTSETNLHLFVCIIITLGLGILAFAVARWRDGAYWRLLAVLIVSIAVPSLWRLYPLVSDPHAMGEIVEWSEGREFNHDLLSHLGNFHNPVTAPFFKSIFSLDEHVVISAAAYFGVVPLVLIGLVVIRRDSRRKALPWLFVVMLFFGLSLGSTLVINGTTYRDFPLPKQYLDQLLPTIFVPFKETDHFIMGLTLPLAVSATYGLRVLRNSFPSGTRKMLVVALIAIVAFEYYVPPKGNLIESGRFAFLDWLADEEEPETRLINVPMGRHDAKRYSLYQALSGYPSAEGAISRPPPSAFDYIYANQILGTWRSDRPAICRFDNQHEYLEALGQLETDGFTHVVYHRTMRDSHLIAQSFLGALPAYRDEYVSIFRIGDLRSPCPRNFIPERMSEAHAAETLLDQSVLKERHGALIGFQGDLPLDEELLRWISQATFDQKWVISVAEGADKEIIARSSNEIFHDLNAISDVNDALWLVNSPIQTDLQSLDIYRDWFLSHYTFCRRYLERQSGTIDLYVRTEIPCVAAVHQTAVIQYDNGIRLNNFSVDVASEELTLFLSWFTPLNETYSFSIQILDVDGNKVLQYDNAIVRQPVSLHKVEHDLPSGNQLTLTLVVYDFDTGKSVGGTVPKSLEGFTREVTLSTVEV